MEIKKAGSNDPTNLLTLGVGAKFDNSVLARLAGVKKEYWPLNQTSTLLTLLVGVSQAGLSFPPLCKSPSI